MAGYRPQSHDTSAEVEQLMFERYRRMTPAQKLGIMCQLCEASQQLALAGIRLRHPDADEKELRMRLAATRVPASLLREAFGWDPDER